jgi:hypothetical protein
VAAGLSRSEESWGFGLHELTRGGSDKVQRIRGIL